MRKTLVIKVFEKAKKTIHTDVTSQLSTHISDVLLEDYKYLVNERTLRNYYNEAVETSLGDIKIATKNELYLSKYLGYENYQDYLIKNGMNKQKVIFPKKALTVGGPILALLLSYFIYNSFKKECMVWTNNDHFEKLSCNVKGDFESVELNDVLLENFKRVEPDCNYQFFKMDGSANLWYGKNLEGDLEYFSYHGIHPVTGKTLKEITVYMVKKYLCDKNLAH